MNAIVVDEEYKKRLEGSIVEAMLTALDNETLTEEEIPDVADYVLDEMEHVLDHDDVMEFLRDLSSKWRIFSGVLVKESGEIKEKKEDEVANDVLKMAQSGNIEGAITLAQSMTEESVNTQPTQTS